MPPELALLCHWMVGVGLPLAAAWKLAGALAQSVRLVGAVLTLGATFTVTDVTLEVVGAQVPLVFWARY